MTNKNPVRSCEDVDESVLNYAEIKALCIGDSRIKEKMDLDIQVTKLRMLEGSHKSQQYRLQDKVLQFYPKEIERTKERMGGLEKDLERWSAHTSQSGDDEKFSMTVSGEIFGKFNKDEKKEAGEALLKTCNGYHGAKTPVIIGEYKGFDMAVVYNFVTQKLNLNLKADGVTHQIELGESASGNITRIDNALNRIPEHLASAKNHMDDLHKQLEDAKAEAERPFPQAQELKDKLARLAELDILLNMAGQKDQKDQKDQEERAATNDEPDIDLVNQETKQNTDTENEGLTKQEEQTEQEEQTADQLAESIESAESTKSDKPTRDLPEIGDRVIIHTNGSERKLSGYVRSHDEESGKVMVHCGNHLIPVYKDKVRFEIVEKTNSKDTSIEKIREADSNPPLKKASGNGFER